MVMRKLIIILALILLISITNGLRIDFKGYSGGNITIEILSLNTQMLENFTVQNSSVCLNLPNGSYHIVIRYNGLEYFKRVDIPRESSIQVNFNRTKNLSALIISSYHFIVDREDGNYVVIEMVKFKNTGNSFFSGNIEKKLPKKFWNLMVDRGHILIPYKNLSVNDSTILIENAFLQPNGSFVLAYIYNTRNPEIVLDYNVKNLSVIFPKDLKVSLPSNFSFNGEIKSRDGKIYYIYSASNVKEGVIKLRISENREKTYVLILVITTFLISTAILYILEKKSESDKSDWEI